MPKEKRQSVAITYLLARYADTIADSGTWPTETRLTYLRAWENAILRKSTDWEVHDSVGGFKDEEAALMMRGRELLSLFWDKAFEDREASREVLKTLIGAMRWDMKTFSRTEEGPAYGVRDQTFFDWYCFSIAGCVGTYWTNVFQLDPSLDPLGVSYGKGLQRINILRDVPEDWQRGRVYLPETLIKERGFQLDQPLWRQSPWSEFVKDFCKETRQLLIHGAQYCDALPYSELRLKWASKMPLYIGLKTLDLLETSSWQKRIKVSRPEVKALAKKAFWSTLLNTKLTKSLIKS